MTDNQPLDTRKPVRHVQLANQIIDILLERIQQKQYPPGCRFPTEHELAAEFNVSRATIRTAMSFLSNRGFVLRQQGVGTFVSQLSHIANPLNEAIDFNQIIRSYGYIPSIEFVSTDTVIPHPSIAESLHMQPADKAFFFRKIFFADRKPLIYVENYMPLGIFKPEHRELVLGNPESTEPLFTFLEEICGFSIMYHLAKLRVRLARDIQFPDFPYDPLKPIQIIEETSFNTEEIPLWFSREYFPEDLIDFTLIRRRDILR